MNKYHKIQTIYKRDPATKNKTLLKEFALPEFAYLASNTWVWTEKVDGTNIRVDWDSERVRFGGRTDNAQIPASLVDRLNDLFLPHTIRELPPMTFYGEGYGVKIQKGGENYKADGVDFVLFDILCNGWWLERENVQEIASKISLRVVPVIGTGTLTQLTETVKRGFGSVWGDFPAEGIVARPTTELCNRAGHRIITKLKTKDFAGRMAKK